MSADLARAVLDLCVKRGWSTHWTHRGVYLHLEVSELIEALRGKHGDPLEEAADVLIVLTSITEANGMAWPDVVDRAWKKVIEMREKPRWAGELRAEDAA